MNSVDRTVDTLFNDMCNELRNASFPNSCQDIWNIGNSYFENITMKTIKKAMKCGEERNTLKEQALSKLTEEEKEVLGLV